MAKRFFPFKDKDRAVASIQALVTRNLSLGESEIKDGKLTISRDEKEFAFISFDNNRVFIGTIDRKKIDRECADFLNGLVSSLREYYGEVFE